MQAVDEKVPIDQFPLFFEETKLNFAENLLFRKLDGIAVIDVNESNLDNPTEHTWKDLRELVRRYASALKSSGVKKGSVVACMFPSDWSMLSR